MGNVSSSAALPRSAMSVHSVLTEVERTTPRHPYTRTQMYAHMNVCTSMGGYIPPPAIMPSTRSCLVTYLLLTDTHEERYLAVSLHISIYLTYIHIFMSSSIYIYMHIYNVIRMRRPRSDLLYGGGDSIERYPT